MFLLELVYGGLYALLDYVALHVLTCLIPAFLLAGAMVSFISRQSVMKYFGYGAKKTISYPLATVSGFFLAVCSCTVIPLSAGIHRRGGGVGPAFIILWVAPATNLLALIYTGAIVGFDMAAVRVLVAVFTGFIIGLVMTRVFRREERRRAAERAKEVGYVSPAQASDSKVIGGRDIVLLLLLAVTLLIPNYLGVGKPYSYKVILFAIPMAVTIAYVKLTKNIEEIKSWLHETLWFVRLIFPLLLIGVFVVGVVGKVIPPGWVETWLSGSGIFPSFLGSIIGALMYFATLTEAPFVKMLMTLGMGRGPALALLLNGPGLSLPSMVAIMRVYGFRKMAVYVLLTVMLATIGGVVAGNLVWNERGL